MGGLIMRRMGNGTSESVVFVAIGSKTELHNIYQNNTHHFTSWFDIPNSGDRTVQSIDYEGGICRLSIESWAYSDKGGGAMDCSIGTSQPFQESINNYYGTYPSTQSL